MQITRKGTLFFFFYLGREEFEDAVEEFGRNLAEEAAIDLRPAPLRVGALRLYADPLRRPRHRLRRICGLLLRRIEPMRTRDGEETLAQTLTLRQIEAGNRGRKGERGREREREGYLVGGGGGVGVAGEDLGFEEVGEELVVVVVTTVLADAIRHGSTNDEALILLLQLLLLTKRRNKEEEEEDEEWGGGDITNERMNE